jgi:hypothetical protein
MQRQATEGGEAVVDAVASSSSPELLSRSWS